MSLRSKFITLLLILNSLLILFSLALYMNVSTNNRIKREVAIIDSVNKAFYEEIIAVRGFFSAPLGIQLRELDKAEKALDTALADVMQLSYLPGKSGQIGESIKKIISARYDSLFFMPVMLDNADKILNEIGSNMHNVATINMLREITDREGNEQLRTRMNFFTSALYNLEENIITSLSVFEEQYRTIAEERSNVERGGIITFIIMFLSIAIISLIAGALIMKSIISVTRNLDKALKETDAVFKNIHEGIFQLDDSLKIGPLCSNYFEELFFNIDFREKTFTKFLSEIGVPGKEVSVTEDYLKLFFNEGINLALLGQVNPLDKVTVSLIDKNGLAAEKYLSFSFSVFRNVNDRMEILGTVKDITDEVLYAEALREEEEKNREKMEQMFQVLHVDPEVMAEFFEDSQNEIDHINGLLKSNREDYRETLQEIFMAVHSIKGNAQLLGMKNLASMLHRIEDSIKGLLDQKVIIWENILDFAIRLKDIQEGINDLKERIREILEFQSNFRGLADNAGLFERALQRVLFTEGAQAGKVINLECSSFNSREIPEEHRKLVKDIFIQLARNSVSHGIEKPEERAAKKKNSSGTIYLSMSRYSDPESDAGYIDYCFRDDGAGINVDLVAKKARASGLIKEGEQFSLSDAVKYIFSSGFSTADSANLGAGRGIGLSIVKSRVSAAKGKIKVKTQRDRYCEFIITLPSEAAEIRGQAENRYA